MDLIFVIDESTSVGLENFYDEVKIVNWPTNEDYKFLKIPLFQWKCVFFQIKFVSRFVSGVPVDINHTRVAVVTFADRVTSWVNQVSMGEIHAHKCSLLGRDLPAIEYM